MYVPFVEQYIDMLSYSFSVEELHIGTLGPTETSSVQALQYFTDCLLKHNCKSIHKFKLYDNFDDVLNAVLSQQINFALVPSAYKDITKYFWNPNLTNVFNFMFPTPKYGIVANNNYLLESKNFVRIATCEPVECLIDTLLDNSNRKIIKVITPSTTKALEALLIGNADLAVTNETSFSKYNDTYGIKFISECYSVQMLWSLFTNIKL